jgi:hypothetical protein
MKGAYTPRTLAEDLFCLLRVLWRTHNSDYDVLVSKFEADQSDHRRHKRARLLVDGIADWNPEHKHLNPTERRWATMRPNVKVGYHPQTLNLACTYYYKYNL